MQIRWLHVRNQRISLLGVTSHGHVCFAPVFSMLNPIQSPCELMPKPFVSGARVHSLCKSVFGDREARHVHCDGWKTATIQGVILPASRAGHKVWVEWEDAANNLHKVSEHGVQTFLQPEFNENQQSNNSSADCSSNCVVQGSSTQPAQNRAQQQSSCFTLLFLTVCHKILFQHPRRVLHPLPVQQCHVT